MTLPAIGSIIKINKCGKNTNTGGIAPAQTPSQYKYKTALVVGHLAQSHWGSGLLVSVRKLDQYGYANSGYATYVLLQDRDEWEPAAAYEKSPKRDFGWSGDVFAKGETETAPVTVDITTVKDAPKKNGIPDMSFQTKTVRTKGGVVGQFVTTINGNEVIVDETEPVGPDEATEKKTVEKLAEERAEALGLKVLQKLAGLTSGQ
jgi:hypothetical protein